MKRLLLFFTLLLYGIGAHAQIDLNDLPFSIQDTIEGDSISESSLNTIQITPPSSEEMDLEAEAGFGSVRFAIGLEADVNFLNQATTHILSDGSVLKRLRLQSVGASSLAVLFNTFYLPVGARLHVYSEDKLQVGGAYTDANNNPNNSLLIHFIHGESVIIEYLEPPGMVGTPDLNIDKVFYDYSHMLNETPGEDSSLPCQIDIACSEGDEWRDEARAVVKLRISGKHCSGVLLNNTSEDGTAYILTSLHCIDDNHNGIMSTAEIADVSSNTLASFNFQSFNCGDTDDTNDDYNYYSLSGCDVVAYNPDTDFALLKFHNKPPSEYSPYYAGWDATGNTPTAELAAISHPKGDRKKIALEYSPASNVSWPLTAIGWSYSLPGNHSWLTSFDVGMIEEGSSGSGLFEQGGYVVGNAVSVSSIPTDCDPNTYGAYYGKLSESFIGTTPSDHLEPWLDPAGTGTLKFRGRDPQCSSRTIVNKTYNAPSNINEEAHRFLNVAPNVTVEASASYVDFTATNRVKFLPGFEVEYGGHARGMLSNTDCPSTPVVTIIGPSSICRPQNEDYEAMILYGKPPYTYSWSNNRNSQSGTGSSFQYNTNLFSRNFRLTLEVTDANGVVGKSSMNVNVEGPLGCKRDLSQLTTIEEVDAETQETFTIFPNPTEDELTLSFGEETQVVKQITIYDMLGKIVDQFSMKGSSMQLSVDQYPKGLYIINAKADNMNYSKKIMVY